METSKLDDVVARALDRFARGTTVAERGAAITELLTRRTLSRVVQLDAFQRGLDRLVQDLITAHDPVTKLTALAQLGRIEQSARTIASKVRQITAPALETEIPPARLLKEADERFYVAKTCSWVTYEWVLPYAIRTIVEESPNADAVRAELIRLVFRDAPSLANVFARLAQGLADIKLETESPADSIAKRLTKVLGSLRQPIAISLLPSGEEVGTRLGDLARKPFSAVGLPPTEDVRLALANEIVMCTHDVVRTRFSVSTDAETYAAVKFARRLFPGTGWPMELKDALALITDGILEAILLLGKQGIASRPLVEHLELVSGSRERAAAKMREVAEKNPGLPESVRTWLKGEKPTAQPRAGDAIEASAHLRVDPSLGDALIEVQRVEEAKSAVVDGVIPALELYDPAKVGTINTLIARVDGLVASINDVAIRRRLGLLGTPGETIDFLPKYFESTKGAGAQRVRVLRSAVVRLGDDGYPGEAVVKGLVE